jgi:hypothetical protein
MPSSGTSTGRGKERICGHVGVESETLSWLPPSLPPSLPPCFPPSLVLGLPFQPVARARIYHLKEKVDSTDDRSRGKGREGGRERGREGRRAGGRRYLGEVVELGREPSVHAHDLVFDDGGHGHAVEKVRERAPELDRVSEGGREGGREGRVEGWTGNRISFPLAVFLPPTLLPSSPSPPSLPPSPPSPPLAFVVKAIDAVQGSTFVISAQKEERLGVAEWIEGGYRGRKG